MIGLRHTATVTSTVTKEVVCGYCGCRFSYQMRCTGEGVSFSPYFIGAKEGAGDAQAEANVHLARRAKSQFEPIPGPSCFRYQKNMVRQLREKHLRWVSFLGLGLVVFGGVALSFNPIGGIALILGAALILVRWIKAVLLQPNSSRLEERRAIAAARAQVID